MPTNQADLYIRFLNYGQTLREAGQLPPLDPLEERILALIAQSGHLDQRLSVRDMMARSEFGSPATIHTRLKSMRAKGWIQYGDTEDSRRKQLEITKAASQYFDKLGRRMLRLAGEAAADKRAA